MLHNLVIGTAIICVTVLIHTFGLIVTTSAMSAAIGRLKVHGHRSRIIVMVSIVLALFAIITLEVWFWAGCYVFLGVMSDIETAVYFSSVTFSTIGYGDVVPGQTWRMLAALEGINGFLLIGWSTAYLVAAGTRFGPFRAGEHF